MIKFGKTYADRGKLTPPTECHFRKGVPACRQTGLPVGRQACLSADRDEWHSGRDFAQTRDRLRRSRDKKGATPVRARGSTFSNSGFTPLEKAARELRSLSGFTFIEILIVVTIIAILAATVFPNFVGFDAEARVTATKSNLESIRTSVNLYRAKEGKYPVSLGDLTTTYFLDMGVKQSYLRKMPAEMITIAKGNAVCIEQSSETNLSGEGGWAYFTDTAEVKVNVTSELGKKWGSYANENPSEW